MVVSISREGLGKRDLITKSVIILRIYSNFTQNRKPRPSTHIGQVWSARRDEGEEFYCHYNRVGYI